MNASWLLSNLIAELLLPPLNLLLLGLVGWVQWERRPRLGRALVAVSLGGFWLLCTPIVASGLLETLQGPYQPIRGNEADAIVVLGGGSSANVLEFGGDTVNARTLERLRYGAWLYRNTGRPVLVTGGAPEGGVPEGRLMRDVLEQEFRVPVAWVEDRSINTRENARYSAEILRRAGIRRIYLVSHVWHLPRAIPEFERQGLDVVPAGTGYRGKSDLILFDFVPDARALSTSYFAFHEWIGLLWYSLSS